MLDFVENPGKGVRDHYPTIHPSLGSKRFFAAAKVPTCSAKRQPCVPAPPTMKSSIRFALVSTALVALSVLSARAMTVTYEVQFTNPGFLAEYGAGSLTLDDTPVAPHYLGPPYDFTTPTAVGFDFINVSGTGTDPGSGFGAWMSSFLDYDPVSGAIMWDLQLTAKAFSCEPVWTPGVSPFDAFETALDMGPATGWWTWEKSATPVPAPESCSAAILLGIGLVALGALRIARRRRP